MKDKELQQMLQELQHPAIDQKRKEQSIRAVMTAANKFRAAPHMTYWARIRNMAGFISPWVWIVQAALVALCGFYLAISGEDMVMIAGLMAPLVGCIGCVEVQRGFGCGMWEMEKACRYDLRQVVLLKMQITGGTDFLIVLCLVVFGTGSGVTFQQAVLEILVPYLAASAVYFAILSKKGRRVSNFVLMAAGIFMTVLFQGTFGNMDEWSWAFIHAHGEWVTIGVMLTAGAMLLAMRLFWKACDREENNRLWNFD